MKTKLILFILYIIAIQLQAQNNTYHYYSGSTSDGFSQDVQLTLNADQSFSYKFTDNQVCYETITLSYGNYTQKGDSIYLRPSNQIKPKVSFKKESLKKGILTVFFNRANEKTFFKEDEYFYDSGEQEFTAGRQLFFYDAKNNKIEVDYNYGGILEIPKRLGVVRIEMYIPNTNHKDNYLEINIPKNTEQVVIDRLSRYAITDFARYSFALHKNTLKMKYPWGEYKLKKE